MPEITPEHRERLNNGRRDAATRRRNELRAVLDDFRTAIQLESEAYRRVLKVREIHGAGSPQEVEARHDWTDAWLMMPRIDELPDGKDPLWDEP